jgi:hypothetical protein
VQNGKTSEEYVRYGSSHSFSQALNHFSQNSKHIPSDLPVLKAMSQYEQLAILLMYKHLGDILI